VKEPRPGTQPEPNQDGLASTDWLHFVGVGGSGMSALAQLHAMAGGRTTGSDRAFDDGERAEIREHLEKLGITIVPQDGSAPQADSAAIVVSTAVEETIADVRTARELGVPILHRSELLAHHVTGHRTIAITGTSGKSTVTAMVFAILRGAGLDPSLLTGGPLTSLQDAGYLGNAWAGQSVGQIADQNAGQNLGQNAGPTVGQNRWLVIEADESDGSLVRYRPWAGVVLNLQRDHKEPEEVARYFMTFKANCSGPFLIGEDIDLRELKQGATVFGCGDQCDVRAVDVVSLPDGSSFTVDGVSFTLPLPGLHNVHNATAAIAACAAAEVPLAAMTEPLRRFGGVARRMRTVGSAAGVQVIDDFAHNPDKIAAALATVHLSDRRILAVFQPHGYGPTRFLRDDLIAAFAAGLAQRDVLWLPEIYYAGGTVTRDISSADLADGITARGRDARFVPARNDIAAAIAALAEDGDLVIVMGARDPSLTDFCREILRALAAVHR